MFPTANKIISQLREQREAIEHVISGTAYAEYSFHYLALTVNALDLSSDPNWVNSSMTWSELIDILKPGVYTQDQRDVLYVFEVLERAIARAMKEIEDVRVIDVHWDTVRSIDELFRRGPELLAEGFHYVGIDRSVKELEDMKIEDMETRREYKYSKKKGAKRRNWRLLNDVVSHYLNLKREMYVDNVN